MKPIRQISEIAKLFHLPAATLHYWEKEKLFHIHRNPDNLYREYTLTDIMNIWEIVLYRKLGISLTEIRTILNTDIRGQLNTYLKQEDAVSNQIQELEHMQKDIIRQENLARMVMKLQHAGLHLSVPDISFCVHDPFDRASIELSLQNPSRCCMMITEDTPRKYIHAIIPDEMAEKKELLWQLSESDTNYMEFLLRISIYEPNHNNLDNICKKLNIMGYQTGHIIAHYLLLTGNSHERYEYYQAWIQVFPF